MEIDNDEFPTNRPNKPTTVKIQSALMRQIPRNELDTFTFFRAR